jgi:hypothetical protein
MELTTNEAERAFLAEQLPDLEKADQGAGQ